MADKRHVKQTIKQLQRVKTWQLLVLLLLMCFVAATFLRLNNIGMSERRAATLSADSSADTTAIENRLYELQRYSSTHMNASTGPFYLEEQYKRDVKELTEAASSQGTVNSNINAEVDALCKSRFSSYSQAWVQCFSDELAKYPPSADPATTVTLPSTDLYRYSFASPLWTPDFAGLSVVICLAIIAVILARMLGLFILHLMLKKHYRGV